MHGCRSRAELNEQPCHGQQGAAAVWAAGVAAACTWLPAAYMRVAQLCEAQTLHEHLKPGRRVGRQGAAPHHDRHQRRERARVDWQGA